MRRLRAGALSAVCPLLALALLGRAVQARAAQPCPAFDTAKAVAASVRDKKEIERELDAALAQCGAAGATVPPAQTAAPAPSIKSEIEPDDVAGTPSNVSPVSGNFGPTNPTTRGQMAPFPARST